MFPPDEENPILNPKEKTAEQVQKEKEERDEAIKFLHYKSVTTPLRKAPPGPLITLVGAFRNDPNALVTLINADNLLVTTYGFHSASRLCELIQFKQNRKKKRPDAN